MASDSDDLVDAMMSWAEAKGIFGADKIKEAYFDKGGHQVRGMAAREATETGPLLKVPQELLLAVKNPALNKGLFPDSVGEGQTEDTRVKLLGLVATHRKMGKNSTFAPYLAELPSLEDFASFHPVMANAALLAEFEDAPLARQVKERQEEQERQWERWQQVIGESGGSSTGDVGPTAATVGREDFVWAHMVCLTRCFDLHWALDGGSIEDTVGLVPVADNCNTDAAPNVWWRADRSDPAKPTMQLTVLKSLGAGDEILIPYAAAEHPMTNEDFAEEWGFPLANNPNKLEDWPKDDKRCTSLSSIACTQTSAGPDAQPVLRSTFVALAAEHCNVPVPTCA